MYYPSSILMYVFVTLCIGIYAGKIYTGPLSICNILLAPKPKSCGLLFFKSEKYIFLSSVRYDAQKVASF